MALDVTQKRTCIRCGRPVIIRNNFYKLRNKDEYMHICRKCCLAHVDWQDPDTFIWILKEIDLPWIPVEMQDSAEKQFKKWGDKVTSAKIFGAYITKIRLNQFKGLGYADSADYIAKQEERKAAAKEKVEEYKEMLNERKAAGEINEEEYQAMLPIEESDITIANPVLASLGHETQTASIDELIGQDNQFNEKNFVQEEELPDVSSQLTDEDKIYLATKWGRFYTLNELVQLEQKYVEMIDSFSISDSDSISTLKLICKTDLKANQALDSGDFDGFQKLSRVLDSQRKSANFSASARKAVEKKDFDSIGEIVLLCEKEKGFIPPYPIDIPLDVVDTVIMDMKAFNRSLIETDPLVFKQVEAYIKKKQILEDMEKDSGPITDKDFADFREDLEKQISEDKMNYTRKEDDGNDELASYITTQL